MCVFFFSSNNTNNNSCEAFHASAPPETRVKKKAKSVVAAVEYQALTVNCVVSEDAVLGVSRVEVPLHLEHEAVRACLRGEKGPVLCALVRHRTTRRESVRVRDLPRLSSARHRQVSCTPMGDAYKEAFMPMVLQPYRI